MYAPLVADGWLAHMLTGITHVCRYRHNELWLDVEEKVSCVISPSGQMLSAHCAGIIKMKCQVSLAAGTFAEANRIAASVHSLGII